MRIDMYIKQVRRSISQLPVARHFSCLPVKFYDVLERIELSVMHIGR